MNTVHYIPTASNLKCVRWLLIWMSIFHQVSVTELSHFSCKWHTHFHSSSRHCMLNLLPWGFSFQKRIAFTLLHICTSAHRDCVSRAFVTITSFVQWRLDAEGRCRNERATESGCLSSLPACDLEIKYSRRFVPSVAKCCCLSKCNSEPSSLHGSCLIIVRLLRLPLVCSTAF